MNGSKLRVAASAVLILFLVSAPSRADLFAHIVQSGEILRIDSTTGNVTRRYDIPEWLFPAPLSNSGMAFDGKHLYMSSVQNQVWTLDVTENIWFLPSFLETSLPEPLPHQIPGLAFLPNEFGGNLVAVARGSGGGDAYLRQYMGAPFFFPDLMFPFDVHTVDLNDDVLVMGADFDPINEELWITADDFGGPPGLPLLMRVDLEGTILQSLALDLGAITPTRGLGFDGGAMFLATRIIPGGGNRIYEIDRVTGEAVRSFDFPGPNPIASITGGEVIPEPSTAVLMLLASIGSIAIRRRRNA
jgi:hypothetical protein